MIHQRRILSSSRWLSASSSRPIRHREAIAQYVQPPGHTDEQVCDTYTVGINNLEDKLTQLKRRLISDSAVVHPNMFYVN